MFRRYFIHNVCITVEYKMKKISTINTVNYKSQISKKLKSAGTKSSVTKVCNPREAPCPSFQFSRSLQSIKHTQHQGNLLDVLADDVLPAASWSAARLSPVWRWRVELHHDVFLFFSHGRGPNCYYDIVQSTNLKKTRMRKIKNFYRCDFDPHWVPYTCSFVLNEV